MASPQIENGYIRIANELMEALYSTEGLLKGSQGQMILAIIRKTYGYHKKEDSISISQFCKETNLSKRTVIYTLQQLEAKNIVRITRSTKDGLKDSNRIYFNKDYETWALEKCSTQVEKNRKSALKRYHKGVVQKYVKEGGGSAKVRQKVVQKSVKKLQTFAHTKERNINKRNSEDKSSQTKKKNMENEPIIDMDSGEYIDPPKPQTKKYPNSREVFKLWGKYPANWKINKTQLLSAENLFKERGLVQVKKALELVKKHKDNQFCPHLSTPYDVDSKWAKIVKFKKQYEDR